MEKQIYYHDTDAGGVVYYGNYLKYLEEARTEFFASKGLNVRSLSEEGFLYAVRKCSIVYKSPARYGDVITCDAKLLKVTAVQIMFHQNIFHKITGDLLVEADVNLVSLNSQFKPAPIPDRIRDRLCG